MQFAPELILRDEICAVQLFGRNLLECIPSGSVILADRPSSYVRMFEVVWEQKRYVVFQRDLEERTEPVRHAHKSESAQASQGSIGRSPLDGKVKGLAPVLKLAQR